jgi:hypothetical protein
MEGLVASRPEDIAMSRYTRKLKKHFQIRAAADGAIFSVAGLAAIYTHRRSG